ALDRDLARDLAKELKLDDLAAALDALTVPKSGASRSEWQAYAEQLQAIIAAHRPSVLVLRRVQQEIAESDSYPKLTNEQWRRMADYLKATGLLLDCLDVAYVSDRPAIEEQLLR
ncbi:MAG: hypothetical protein J5I90_04705, partial [Caldilineales bacterium]|nr:hypothetical protein [Caldilineales bacterium]